MEMTFTGKTCGDLVVSRGTRPTRMIHHEIHETHERNTLRQVRSSACHWTERRTVSDGMPRNPLPFVCFVVQAMNFRANGRHTSGVLAQRDHSSPFVTADAGSSFSVVTWLFCPTNQTSFRCGSYIMPTEL